MQLQKVKEIKCIIPVGVFNALSAAPHMWTYMILIWIDVLIKSRVTIT